MGTTENLDDTVSDDGSLQEEASAYWLQLEEVTTHVGGDLDGMTTYRLYLNCLNPLDFLSSCSGDENNPLALTSTATPAWFNSAFATGWNAQAVNPAFFAFFPDIAHDSYLTIGAEDGSYASAYQCSGQWGDINVPEEFNGDGPGESILLNDQVGGGTACFLGWRKPMRIPHLPGTTCASWWPSSPPQVRFQAKSKCKSSKTEAKPVNIVRSFPF